MFEMFDRQELAELTQQQLAPLEALMPAEWPGIWRELAISHYLTLISSPGAEQVHMTNLACMAMALTMGIAQDLGGSQPYIPVGTMLAANARARQVVEMLERGCSYKRVADATGLTDNWIRRIEAEWRKEQIEQRQGRLQLD